MCDQRRVFGVRNDDAGKTLRGAVGVECVGFLFNVLSDARTGAFGHGFGEHGHEFAVAGRGDVRGRSVREGQKERSPVSSEAGEGREVSLDGEFGGGDGIIAEDLKAFLSDNVSQASIEGAAYSDVEDLHDGGEGNRWTCREAVGVEGKTWSVRAERTRRRRKLFEELL